MVIVKIISALMAFLMSVLSFGSAQPERRCNPEFNGTFIQSWMSGSWDDERWQTEIENMQNAGIEYLIVEQDRTYDTPALEAVKQSREFLKNTYGI